MFRTSNKRIQFCFSSYIDKNGVHALIKSQHSITSHGKRVMYALYLYRLAAGINKWVCFNYDVMITNLMK